MSESKIEYWHRQTLRDKSAEVLKDWKEDRARLEVKVEKLTKCVEFYADRDNWEIPDIDSRGFSGMSAKSIIELEDYDADGLVKGKLARKTLEEIKEGEEV